MTAYDWDIFRQNSKELPELPQVTWRGKVTGAPSSVTTRAKVAAINAADGGLLELGEAWWVPKANGSLPVRGQECLIVLDDSLEPWVVAWTEGIGGGSGLLAPGAPTNPARSLGTAYRPSLTRPTFVTLTFLLSVSAAQPHANVVIAVSSNNVSFQTVSQANLEDAATVTCSFQVALWVPASYYYRASQVLAGAGITIPQVTEQTF